MQFTLPSETFTNDTKPDNSNPVHRAAYNWNGEQYMGVQPSDMFITDVATNKPFKVVPLVDLRATTSTKYVQLSLLVEWQLNNLDASFEKIVGTRKRTVMVYSDLVESNCPLPCRAERNSHVFLRWTHHPVGTRQCVCGSIS